MKQFFIKKQIEDLDSDEDNKKPKAQNPVFLDDKLSSPPVREREDDKQKRRSTFLSNRFPKMKEVQQSRLLQPPKSQGITAAQYIVWFQHQDHYVVDIRTYQELQTGYISKSIHVPFTKLSEFLQREYLEKKYIQNKNFYIIIICSSGQRAHVALKIFQQIGYFPEILKYISDGFTNYKLQEGEYQLLNSYYQFEKDQVILE